MSILAIIGAGYVGLVTGACLAQKGYKVVIIENNPQKIEQLYQGKIPFYEPGLEKIVTEAINKKGQTPLLLAAQAEIQRNISGLAAAITTVMAS